MEQHTCQNRDCDLPGTEKRTAYQQRWGGLLGRKRLPDKEHRLWFCPKHARWYDHPEDAQPEVPEPWFEDRIKVTEVDVEFDFDSLGDHAPSELTVEEMARDGQSAGPLLARQPQPERLPELRRRGLQRRRGTEVGDEACHRRR